MQINQAIFREYDIRGIVGKDLSEELAYALGRAFAEKIKEEGRNKIAIGHDCRLSSPSYAACLAQGLAEGGVDAVMVGMGPTPQLYFSIFKYDFGGGIQVTGSHNPADMNGFKMCIGTRTLAGSDIQDLKQRILALVSNELHMQPTGAGKITEKDIREEYISTLSENCKPFIGKRRLKVVVDAGNGVGGLVGPEVLRRLGVEVIEMYCEPDGRFPNHHPDPTVMENIRELGERVILEKADFGIGWDGDADRIGVVDEKGEPIFGDMLTLLYARDILKSKPGAVIIGDVKCSSRLFKDVHEKGGKPVMWKTGHSLIKAKLKELKGELAGEMSGHIMFANRFYGFDDACYASARFVELVSKTDKAVSQLLTDIPPAVSTPEIRVDCPDDIKFRIAEMAKEKFQDYKVDLTDGVRVEFEKGWGLVRASNTQPVLVMRFEAENEKLLKEYQTLFENRLEDIKKELH